MQITAERLKEIILGALRTEEKDGYISFFRFTKSQINLLTERGYSSRALCTASIKLEFCTRGGEVAFDYKISPGTRRAYYSVDVLVDGVYKYNVSDTTDEICGKFSFCIPESLKYQRVTVYFPTTAVMSIANLVLPDDHIPHSRKTKILMLGDSMLQGYYPNHFQNTYANILSDSFEADSLNQAIGGDCFYENNLEKTEFEPDMIIVSYGINDWVSGKFKNGEEAERYFKRLSDLWYNVPVFVIIPPTISSLEKTRKNDDMILRADKKSNQTLQEVRNIISHIISKYDNMIPINAKEFIPQYSECFYPDNVHLTDLGNVVFANKLIKEIKKYFK